MHCNHICFSPQGVLVLTAIANNYRLHKLSTVDQFVMMYGGLRGAVAFALVLLIDPKVCFFQVLKVEKSKRFLISCKL
jgi:NhaP-type Na+/H+ or K+/H+ antiporter